MQQYYLEEGQSYWRQKDDHGFPTSGKMIASPDDLDARYSSKWPKTSEAVTKCHIDWQFHDLAIGI